MTTLLLLGALLTTPATQTSHNWMNPKNCLADIETTPVTEGLMFTDLPFDTNNDNQLDPHDIACWQWGYRDAAAHQAHFGSTVWSRGDADRDGYYSRSDFRRLEEFYRFWDASWRGWLSGNWTPITDGEQVIDAADLNEVIFKWNYYTADDLNMVLMNWGLRGDFVIEPDPDTVCIDGCPGAESVAVIVPEPAAWLLIVVGLWRVRR